MKKNFLIIGLSLGYLGAMAQDPVVTNNSSDKKYDEGFRPDGVFDVMPKQQGFLPWEPVREIDVMWKKRFWREIDVRHRQNQAFTWENEEYGDGYFIELLFNAIKNGQVTAFSDERYTIKKGNDAIDEILRGKELTVETVDPETEEVIIKKIRQDFDPLSIVKYRVKEEVYFDKVRGKLFTRIIGIAPIKNVYDNAGNYVGVEAMFWLYYPDLRPVLAQHFVYNPSNDMSSLTWDDYFEKRFFYGNITRTSNEFQADIKEYKENGLEAMYEAERIKEELFNKEQDLWVY